MCFCSLAQGFKSWSDFAEHLAVSVDIVFPVIHGQFGEDGGIQVLYSTQPLLPWQHIFLKFLFYFPFLCYVYFQIWCFRRCWKSITFHLLARDQMSVVKHSTRYEMSNCQWLLFSPNHKDIGTIFHLWCYWVNNCFAVELLAVQCLIGAQQTRIHNCTKLFSTGTISTLLCANKLSHLCQTFLCLDNSNH